MKKSMLTLVALFLVFMTYGQSKHLSAVNEGWSDGSYETDVTDSIYSAGPIEFDCYAYSDPSHALGSLDRCIIHYDNRGEFTIDTYDGGGSVNATDYEPGGYVYYIECFAYNGSADIYASW